MNSFLLKKKSPLFFFKQIVLLKITYHPAFYVTFSPTSSRQKFRSSNNAWCLKFCEYVEIHDEMNPRLIMDSAGARFC